MGDYSSSDYSNESDVEEDEGVVNVYRCLLCEQETTQVPAFFDHLETAHQWNLQEEKKLLNDQYIWISFVNWCRKNKPPHWNPFLSLTEEQRQSYLQPVLDDDPVLMIDVENLIGSSDGYPDKARNVDELQKENAELRSQLSRCRELIGELTEQPTLEYADPPAETNIAHIGYGLNKSILSSPLKPIRFILDKALVSTFREFMTQNCENCIVNKVVLNLFEDAGILSIFAAEVGADRVLVFNSLSSELINAVLESNECKDKVEMIPDLSALSLSRVDVLLWDWLSVFFMDSDQSMLFSLIHSKVDKIYPRTGYVRIVGVSVKSEVMRCLIPSSDYGGVNASALVATAYQKAYLCDWGSDKLNPVTESRLLTTIDIEGAADFLFDKRRVSLTFNSAAKLSGLLIYFDCEIDASGLTFSTRNSTFYGQMLILLRYPIDGLPNQVAVASLARRRPDVLSIAVESLDSSYLCETEIFLPPLTTM